MKTASQMLEIRHWLVACTLMALVSLAVAYPRLLGRPLFVPEFELCIFYLPTLILGSYCLYLKRADFRSRIKVSSISHDGLTNLQVEPCAKVWRRYLTWPTLVLNFVESMHSRAE